MKIIITVLLSLFLVTSAYAWIAVPDPVDCDSTWDLVMQDDSNTADDFKSFAVSYEFDIDNDGEVDESGDLFSATNPTCERVIVDGEVVLIGCDDDAYIKISTVTGTLSA